MQPPPPSGPAPGTASVAGGVPSWMPEGVKDMDGDDDALVSRLSLSGVQDMTHSFGNSPSSFSPRSVDSISKKSAGHVLERLDERRKKDEDMIKDEDMGGPNKIGSIFRKFYEDMDEKPHDNIPEVEVKFKVYRVSDFDMKRSTFYCEVIVMLDWEDPSLEAHTKEGYPGGKNVDFRYHFWPKLELLNQTLDANDEPDWDETLPKYKRRSGKGNTIEHGGSLTVKFRANFFAKMDYRKFPFDYQDLELSIKLLSVCSPGEITGTRPTVRHPDKWRKQHELLPDCNCLSDFRIYELSARPYSSKHGPFPCRLRGEDKIAYLKDVRNDIWFEKAKETKGGHAMELELEYTDNSEEPSKFQKNMAISQEQVNGTTVSGVIRYVHENRKNNAPGGRKLKRLIVLVNDKTSFKEGTVVVGSVGGVELEVTKAKVLKRKLYQDQYTLQIKIMRNPSNVLLNYCFILLVMDLLVFTGHGIEPGNLSDRLDFSITLLLTAMAFKWVLADNLPPAPYLTNLEKYVFGTFAVLAFQGLMFWITADLINFHCDDESAGGTPKNWYTAESVNVTKTGFTGWALCDAAYILDRVVLFLEIFMVAIKQGWFAKRLWNYRKRKISAVHPHERDETNLDKKISELREAQEEEKHDLNRSTSLWKLLQREGNDEDNFTDLATLLTEHPTRICTCCHACWSNEEHLLSKLTWSSKDKTKRTSLPQSRSRRSSIQGFRPSTTDVVPMQKALKLSRGEGRSQGGSTETS